MKLRFLYISLLGSFCLANDSVAQSNLEFSFDVIQGRYDLRDLKEINNEYKNSFQGIDIRKVDNFPAGTFTGGSIWIWKSNFGIGAFLSFGETGSRYSYGDYSGALMLDMLAKSINYGLTMSYYLEPLKNFKCVLELNPGWSLSKVTISDYLAIGSYEEEISSTFTSGNNFLLINGGLKYSWKIFFLKPFIGFQADVNKSKLRDGKAKYNLEADWSGVRYGFSFGFSMFN